MCLIDSWRIERNVPSSIGLALASLFASFSPSLPETKYVAIISKSSIGVTSFSSCKPIFFLYFLSNYVNEFGYRSYYIAGAMHSQKVMARFALVKTFFF